LKPLEDKTKLSIAMGQAIDIRKKATTKCPNKEALGLLMYRMICTWPNLVFNISLL
jgi:hypothetical protein